MVKIIHFVFENWIVFCNGFFDFSHHDEGDKGKDRAKGGDDEVATATGNADGHDDPDGGRCGKAFDAGSGLKDCACAKEADASDDLSR